MLSEFNFFSNAHTKRICHDPSFGLATKARACKGVSRKCSLRITFHVPKSVGKYEGMNTHTPKWAPTLGVGVLMDF
jgi:hypothetical protein